MNRSKIETFRSDILPIGSRASMQMRGAIRAARRRLAAAGRIIGAFAVLVLGGLAPPVPARAAGPAVVLLADRDIDDRLSRAVGSLAPEARRIEMGGADAACTAAPGAKPRLALVSNALSPGFIEACQRSADAQVISVALGHQAVALVAPARAPVWPVSSDALFRALTEHAEKTGRPAYWSDLDARYPKLPIGLLLAPSASVAERLFDSRVVVPSCIAASGEGLPFGPGNRSRYCGMLRRDLPAVQRQAYAQDLASWAASAPAGQLAVVRLAELRQLDGLVIPLPLDGVLPTSANIASGRYGAAETIELLIVVPNDADGNERSEARTMAFDLLAEASIGPDGSLVSAGLVPLAATDRVAARSRALPFLEQPR
jgi:hypothetical protein